MFARKDLLVTGEVYHIFNKSIAEFKIFNNDSDYSRIINVICYYQREKPLISFSNFIKTRQNSFKRDYSEKEKLIEIIAYCVMPTHLHLVLKQLKENGISTFVSNVLNSYSRYFNIRYNRKGPLWEGRFKSVLVKNDEQLLHLTRYIHLNPVTAYLVDNPEEWVASSYKEYLSETCPNALCKYTDILQINPVSYSEFVKNRISFQRDLAKIKNLIIE